MWVMTEMRVFFYVCAQEIFVSYVYWTVHHLDS